MKAAAPEDALRHFDEALALISDDDSRRRADLLFRRGWTLRSVGRWDDGLKDWLEALPLYERLGDTRSAVRICRGIANYYIWSRRLEQTVEMLQRGLDIVGTDPSADRCRLLATAGLSQGGACNYGPGETMLKEAVSVAEQLGSESLLGEVLANKTAFHYYYNEFRESLEDAERGTALLRSAGDLWQLSACMQFSQYALLFLGQPGKAATICEETEPMADRVGHRGVIRLTSQCRGCTDLMLAGDLDGFEAVGREELEMRAHLGSTAEEGGYGILGLADFWRGNWTRARERLERAVGLEVEQTSMASTGAVCSDSRPTRQRMRRSISSKADGRSFRSLASPTRGVVGRSCLRPQRVSPSSSTERRRRSYTRSSWRRWAPAPSSPTMPTG